MASEKDAAMIFNTMQSPYILYYLQFLNFILSKFNSNCCEVQSITPEITQSADQMSHFYKNLLSMYMDSAYVNNTSVDIINPLSESRNVPLNKMEIGEVTKNVLGDKSLTNNERILILQKCKAYVRKACDELKRRLFECDNDSTINRSMFYPENTLSRNYHKHHQNLDAALDMFSTFISAEERQLINEEWNKVYMYQFQKELLGEKNAEAFWAMISDYEEDNQPLFQNLANFAILTFLIPNSNASAERLWSKLNFEKTKLRNKLHFSTVRSILLAAELVKDHGGSISFQPSEAMIMKFLRPEKNDTLEDYMDDDEEVEKEFTPEKEETMSDYDPDLDQCALEDVLYSTSKKAKKRGKLQLATDQVLIFE